MTRLIRAWVRVPLVIRMLGAFALGAAGGLLLWLLGGGAVAEQVAPWVAPFGTVFVNMLRMVVIPVVFLSLVTGAASLPLRRFGRVGLKVLGWYLLTSVLAALVGVAVALWLDPGAGAGAAGWDGLAALLGDQARDLAGRGTGTGSLAEVLLSMFQNPFAALAEGNFLAVIVAALLFGLALRVAAEAAATPEAAAPFGRLQELLEATRDVVFRVVDWVLEYAPVGVLALSLVSFGLYGPAITGPYVSVVLGVVAGVALLVLGVYPLLIALVLRENPFRFLARIQGPMLTAFITRSSAATLPVSLDTARRRLGVRSELAGFSLPLGATVNMDGVCVHLPVFAVLAANLFGLDLTPVQLGVMVLTTVLAAVGAGGVPGGSLMLLFVILGNLGLSADQVAVVVALALGVNPVLDMFETMNNVTGDLVCTWVVGRREGMVDPPEETAGAVAG